MRTTLVAALVSSVLVLIPLSTSPANAQGPIVTTSQVKVYDVLVTAINVNGVPSEANAQNSIEMIEGLDEGFRRETAGKLSFRLQRFETAAPLTITPNTCPSLPTLQKQAKPVTAPITPSPGAVDVIEVYVTPRLSGCTSVAIGYQGDFGVYTSSWGSLRTPDDWYQIYFLAHEVGHNLGLPHASAVFNNASNRVTTKPQHPLDPTAVTRDYGNQASVMGNSGYDARQWRLDAVSRRLLGLVDPKSVRYNTPITITPIDSHLPSSVVTIPDLTAYRYSASKTVPAEASWVVSYQSPSTYTQLTGKPANLLTEWVGVRIQYQYQRSPNSPIISKVLRLPYPNNAIGTLPTPVGKPIQLPSGQALTVLSVNPQTGASIVVSPSTAAGRAKVTIKTRAVKRRTRLKININPNQRFLNYKVKIQKKSHRRWKTVRRTRTKGLRDIRVVNLRKGKYRVKVPRQFGFSTTYSSAVRLRR